MDEKAKLSELQDLGTRLLKSDHYRNIIEQIAHRLVASSFYFLKERFWYDEASGISTSTGMYSIYHGQNMNHLR